MTNVERNLQIILDLKANEDLFNCSPNSMYEITKIAYLEDISKSLASIADSLERSAPREHEDGMKYKTEIDIPTIECVDYCITKHIQTREYSLGLYNEKIDANFYKGYNQDSQNHKPLARYRFKNRDDLKHLIDTLTVIYEGYSNNEY